MQADFWHERWTKNQLGFHESQPNPLLIKHIDALGLQSGRRVFVPLCGKTLDMHWLLAQGYEVIGVELSPIAIEQLFSELGIDPVITTQDALTKYSANKLTVFVGDIFNISREMLGKVDTIYDRAALVALPEPMRIDYTKHLVDISNNANQLVVCMTYDQTMIKGPPFSINRDKVIEYYSEAYDLSLLQTSSISGGLKGKVAADETVWRLTKKDK